MGIDLTSPSSLRSEKVYMAHQGRQAEPVGSCGRYLFRPASPGCPRGADFTHHPVEWSWAIEGSNPRLWASTCAHLRSRRLSHGLTSDIRDSVRCGAEELPSS